MATFGNTTPGSALGTDARNYNNVAKCALSEAGNLSKISIYLNNTSTGHAACNIRAVVYDDDGADGNPGTLIAYSSGQSLADNLSAQWVDLLVTASLAAGNWWLGIQGDGTAAGIGFYGATSGGSYANGGDTYSDGPASSFGTPEATGPYNAAIYGTYTVPSSTVFLPHIFCHHTIPPFIGGH